MASRIYAGILFKQITKEMLDQPGGVMVADHLRIEAELREIYTRISHADPRAATAQQDGNFDANMIQVTTPATVDKELAVGHSLGRTPVAWTIVVPAASGYSMVGSLYNLRDPDSTNLYLAVRSSVDLNRLLALRVW